MSYSLDIDPLTEQQIAALPQTALTALAAALAVLEPGLEQRRRQDPFGPRRFAVTHRWRRATSAVR